MQHEKYIELSTSLLYSEISSKEQADLLQHLLTCNECRADFEEKKKLKDFIIEDADSKVINNELLTQARRELRIALTAEKKPSFIYSVKEAFGSFFSSGYKYALSGVFTLLIGLFIGRQFFTPAQQNGEGFNLTPVKQDDASLMPNTRIMNVQFINSNPDQGEVEFTFEAVKPVHMKGNVNDPEIQNILTYAMINGQNTGIRLNSISLINSKQASSFDKETKEATLHIIKNDPNPGVRREALKLVRKMPYDDDVKKALLYILSNDKNSGIRIEAINIIVDSQKEGQKLTPEEMNQFKQRLQEDESNYMQYKVKTILKENS